MTNVSTEKIIEKTKKADLSVVFLNLWSGDRGAFYQGTVATLPSSVAASLASEGVVRIEG